MSRLDDNLSLCRCDGWWVAGIDICSLCSVFGTALVTACSSVDALVAELLRALGATVDHLVALLVALVTSCCRSMQLGKASMDWSRVHAGRLTMAQLSRNIRRRQLVRL